MRLGPRKEHLKERRMKHCLHGSHSAFKRKRRGDNSDCKNAHCFCRSGDDGCCSTARSTAHARLDRRFVDRFWNLVYRDKYHIRSLKRFFYQSFAFIRCPLQRFSFLLKLSFNSPIQFQDFLPLPIHASTLFQFEVYLRYRPETSPKPRISNPPNF